MTLFLDTSALLQRYVEGEGSSTVIAAMAGDPLWVASALAGVETRIALHRLPVGTDVQERWRQRFADDCLREATRIGTEQGVGTVDAVHLAAAERLPRPFRYLTFDREQAAAARALGFDVLGS
jgi:predicted nucleic acid-binding protein